MGKLVYANIIFGNEKESLLEFAESIPISLEKAIWLCKELGINKKYPDDLLEAEEMKMIYKKIIDDEIEIDNEDPNVDGISISINDDETSDQEENDFDNQKKVLLDGLNNIIQDENIILNQHQKNTVYDYIKKVCECDKFSYYTLATDVLKYMNYLYPFVFIHEAMRALKEGIKEIGNDEISADIKREIDEKMYIINNCNDLNDLKSYLYELEKYMEEHNINADFDTINSGFEQAIEDLENKE